VRDIAFSPDGMHIASVGVDDRTVNVWNTSSGEIAFSLTGSSEWQFINSVEFSPDGKWLATGSYDGTIQLCDASTGREPRIIATRMGNIRGLSFSPDSKQLAAAGSDVTVWGVEMGQQTGKFKVPGMLFDVAFSPNGKRIAACTHEAHVAEWDIATGRETLSHAVRHDRPTFSLIDNHINYVRNVAYRPDGTQLAACSSDGEVRVWNVSRD
jgi:WD40 repeat protein